MGMGCDDVKVLLRKLAEDKAAQGSDEDDGTYLSHPTRLPLLSPYTVPCRFTC